MILNVIWSIVQLVRYPGWDRAVWVLVSLALIVLTTLVRTNPLRAQDRLIRLEEQLRYQRLLPPALAARCAGLSPGQVIALRFASDAELEGLVTRVLGGELSKPRDIKKAIREWRPDTFRV
jgi:hypothetical protein